MQYGHCTAWATASAMSVFSRSVKAPSAKTAEYHRLKLLPQFRRVFANLRKLRQIVRVVIVVHRVIMGPTVDGRQSTVDRQRAASEGAAAPMPASRPVAHAQAKLYPQSVQTRRASRRTGRDRDAAHFRASAHRPPSVRRHHQSPQPSCSPRRRSTAGCTDVSRSTSARRSLRRSSASVRSGGTCASRISISVKR